MLYLPYNIFTPEYENERTSISFIRKFHELHNVYSNIQVFPRGHFIPEYSYH